jgi:hypothetical protein
MKPRFPLNSKREKAYAAIKATKRVIRVVLDATTKLLNMGLKKVNSLKSLEYETQVKFFGQ